MRLPARKKLRDMEWVRRQVGSPFFGKPAGTDALWGNSTRDAGPAHGRGVETADDLALGPETQKQLVLLPTSDIL